MGNVNIIGAGLAGLSCAVTLAKNGVFCNLISVQHSERAQSVLAEGGINAALDTMGEEDSSSEHFADTMRGGVDLADPDAVKGLTDAAPDIVKWLVEIGVPFEMKEGRLILRNFGGQKKKRTAYAKSSTGKALMTALIDEARKYEAEGLIRRYPHHQALDLLQEPGCPEKGNCTVHKCTGVKVLDQYTKEVLLFEGTVILASGGLNGVFPGLTTGTVQNSGAMTAAVFAGGGAIANPEFIQYHPTTVAIPGKRMLISEAARGEGGRLYVMRNGKPWYYMEELFPELGNLMPRDVVSRESVKVMLRDDCEEQIYLDLTGLPEEILNTRLSDMREEVNDYLAVDLAKEPVKVDPGIHFFMGGIRVDRDHKTDIDGLYAAGECACQYHGANRLGGNSLLGAIYGGRVAAKAVINDLFPETEKNADQQTDKKAEPPSPAVLDTMTAEEERDYMISAVFSEKLGTLLYRGLGILRTEQTMQHALSELEDWLRAGTFTSAERRNAMLGKAMLLAALARKESRGAHFRTDHPDRDDAHYKKTTIVRMCGNEITIMFEDIPATKEPSRYTPSVHGAHSSSDPAEAKEVWS